ncbi:Pre-rRNA-processing protein las1 [Babesia sp. Xinjiang]|uniref:Pre-rRNA-processing protein las1 n=1 Tax=Babesia sp. Xinjiang TaxID=462227 RepID=UPI000A23131A|nr:Pre-rRNA-processing protein las1 [Babesia sp. Xinjiang]ORM41784.1 Pre-rRNA-processing protein las1 [Babesia sp. Xinjiang]
MILEPTGWYFYDEFAQVFARLRDPEEYPFIATKIALWKARAKVPAAVTATESLVNAIIADNQQSLSEPALQSLYTVAVIRAVNLLLDHEQDREYARSLRIIAKECDMPEYIITVRHECSHREIPELHTLRSAAFDALNYVYNKYWWGYVKVPTGYDEKSFLRLILRVSALARRLMEGCLHMRFFVSVFVEFVFAHFDPSTETLFLVLLLDIMNQLPFNFVAELAASMLCVVFDLPDVLADGNSSQQPPRYSDRISQYTSFLSTKPAEYIRSVLGVDGAFQRASSHGVPVRHRINGWLLLLLDLAMRFEMRNELYNLPLHLRLLVCAGTDESYSFWIASGNALGRFAAAVHCLLPQLAIQAYARGSIGVWEPNHKRFPWECDPLSHALGLYWWLSKYLDTGIATGYIFSCLSVSKVEEHVRELRKERQGKVSPLDKLLSPGTFWDPGSWKVQYTVTRPETSRTGHSRICAALASIFNQCPVHLPRVRGRHAQRQTRRNSQPSRHPQDLRAFLRLYSQLSVSLSLLSRRERYS